MIRIVRTPTPETPSSIPDIVWDGQIGDWIVERDGPNAGALRSGQALATSVLICLATDARVEPEEVPDGQGNRGWPGDAVDVVGEERPIGSRLWTLRRRSLADPELPRDAEDYAREALECLVDQGAVARFDVVATAVPAEARLDLHVQGFSRSGEVVLNRRYDALWRALDGVAYPLDR